MWITTSAGIKRDVVAGVVMVVLKSDMKSWFEQMIVISVICHMTQFASVSRRRSLLCFSGTYVHTQWERVAIVRPLGRPLADG